MRSKWLRIRAAGVALLGTVLGGCSLFSTAADPLGPAREPGQVITAASGEVTAEFVPGADQNGVPTVVPVIRSGGSTLFQDTQQYSTRHGVAMVWQDSADVLWILSGDVGSAKVERTGNTWSLSPSADVPQGVLNRASR